MHGRALADAAALDGVDPATQPLYGVPFVVKDNIDVAGVPTTAACPGAAYVPDRDADVVARLRAAGAIVVGKANLDQFATGLVGTRSPYGTPPNVLDPALVPGGSSSGSAVAVALGLVPFSLGTDTAGSGRVPAALNGIVGLKPTVGRMSTRRRRAGGAQPRLPVGVRPHRRRRGGRRRGDGRGRRDPTTRPAGQPPPMAWPPRVGVPAAGRRRAAPARRWPRGSPRRWSGSPHSAARSCRSTSSTTSSSAALLYGSALVAERAAAVGELVAKDVDGLDPVVAEIIARAAEHGGVDVYRAEHASAEARRAVADAFADVDVLALPTTLGTATLDEVHDDPVGRNQFLGTLTTFVNLADLACVTVPMAPGIPAGLQLIGPAWSDADLAALADGYDAAARRRATRRAPSSSSAPTSTASRSTTS